VALAFIHASYIQHYIYGKTMLPLPWKHLPDYA